MNDLLSKLMAKKGQDDAMDPDYKNSKLAVLQQLKDEMTKMMGGDLAGLKKVTVAAPDSAGLQDGLDKAKELMSKGVDVDDDSNPATEGDAAPVMMDHEHESDEAEPSEDSDLDAMSPEELQAQIAQLQALLAAKSK